MKDRNTLLFGLLNLLQGAAILSVPFFVASRESAVNWVLGLSGALMVAASPILVLGGRRGAFFAALACLVHGAVGTVLAALIAGSAAYLYGIYGATGRSAGAIAFALAGFVLVVFWLIPAHELKFLRGRLKTQ